MIYGLARRTLPALGAAVAGAALVAYASCRGGDDEADKLRKQVIRSPRRYSEGHQPGDIGDHDQTPRDQVDEAGMESFPGSDSPAYVKQGA